MPTLRRLLPLVLLGALIAPAGALADPRNDERSDAQRIDALPATLQGDLRGAHLEGAEPASSCGNDAASVWYRLDPGSTRRIVLRVKAAGNMDVTLDVFQQVRSAIEPVTCESSDTNGDAAVAFTGTRGKTYLVRVIRRRDSMPSTFSLNAVGVSREVSLPGPRLPAQGVNSRLDRLQRTANAWSAQLEAGVRYRIALSHPGTACIGGAVLLPHAGVDDAPVAMLGCEGYALYTPRRSGRYTVLVRAARGVRGTQPYRLQVARGSDDDSVPGRALRNYEHLRATLDGRRTDRLDLYRFDVTKRSVLFLRLQAPATRHIDLRLISDTGRQIRCTCGGTGAAELRKGLLPGHYFVVVRAKDRLAGAYTLLRAVRTITKAHESVTPTELTPGATTTLTATVEPFVSGPVRFELQQLDPLSGWQFFRTVRGQAVDGTATATFTAPSVGHWRARAKYLGTQQSAPSITGFAPFDVQTPLVAAG